MDSQIVKAIMHAYIHALDSKDVSVDMPGSGDAYIHALDSKGVSVDMPGSGDAYIHALDSKVGT